MEQAFDRCKGGHFFTSSIDGEYLGYCRICGLKDPKYTGEGMPKRLMTQAQYELYVATYGEESAKRNCAIIKKPEHLVSEAMKKPPETVKENG